MPPQARGRRRPVPSSCGETSIDFTCSAGTLKRCILCRFPPTIGRANRTRTGSNSLMSFPSHALQLRSMDRDTPDESWPCILHRAKSLLGVVANSREFSRVGICAPVAERVSVRCRNASATRHRRRLPHMSANWGLSSRRGMTVSKLTDLGGVDDALACRPIEPADREDRRRLPAGFFRLRCASPAAPRRGDSGNKGPRRLQALVDLNQGSRGGSSAASSPGRGHASARSRSRAVDVSPWRAKKAQRRLVDSPLWHSFSCCPASPVPALPASASCADGACFDRQTDRRPPPSRRWISWLRWNRPETVYLRERGSVRGKLPEGWPGLYGEADAAIRDIPAAPPSYARAPAGAGVEGYNIAVGSKPAARGNGRANRWTQVISA